MDINSLLSPTVNAHPAGSQNTAAPAQDLPVATQSPHNHVRRTHSGPLTPGNTASPLLQSTTKSMLSSSIPPYLMSPSQQPPSSPMRSPSAAATIVHNPSSIPNMDTLADLASLQNPRSATPVLRSRESYESQLSPSTIFPHVPAVSVTSNPRASFDVAMVDASRSSVRIDFSGTSLPLEVQQQASLLAASVRERPSAFVAHEQLIKLLHQGFLNHVYPPSSPNAHGDPHQYSLLPDLRAAREHMHRLFAMGENLWVECLEDESMLARTNEEKMTVIDQCLKAIAQEYASTKLWKLYSEWVLHCFNSANDAGTNLSEEEKVTGQIIFTWDLVLEVWRQAVDATKWRLNDSHLVWDQYINVMIQNSQRTNSSEAAANVRDLFEQRLRLPHANWDGTFQNFSNFISNSRYKDDWERIMVEVNKSAAGAKAEWAAREEFETALQAAQEAGDGDAEYQAFMLYLRWERTPEKRKRLLFDLTNALFQRAELRYPSDADIWEDHILWLIEQARDDLSGGLLSVLDRATRHCPWSGALWSQYLLASERQQQPFDETERIKHKATNTGLLDVGGIEEVLKVHAGWCNYLRRRAFRADASDQNEDLDVAEMGIRSSLENVQELAIKLGNGQSLDPQFRLERIYINFLSESGSWDSAKQAFQGFVSKYGNSWEFWMHYYQWEMTRWRTFTQAESQGAKMTKTSRPHYAKAVLKDALKQENLDWPERLMQKLIDHCEDHEGVEDLQQAIIEVRRLEKVVAAKRVKEGAYTQEAAVNQEPPNGHMQGGDAEVLTNGSHTGKRKRGEEELDGESNKKIRNEVEEPSVEKAPEDAPKRDREHATILVQNLPSGVTDTKIRQFFRDCGTINSLKMLQHTASATIEFDERSAAEFALSRSGKSFEGSTIQVYLASGCTLYVTNFPPTADEAFLRKAFEKYGEIVEIRMPSLKGNAGRRFCYIQFQQRAHAEAALAMDGHEAKPGFELVVHISNPENKQQRSGAVEEARQLFIRNLNFKVSEETLQAAFAEYGNVENAKIPKNDKEQSKGYGFITFSSPTAAKVALAMDGKELIGRAIHVTIAENRGAQNKGIISTSRSKPVGVSTMNGDARSPSAMSVSSAGAVGDCRIAIVNLPDTVNVARIRALAERYGAVVKVILKPDHQGALIYFEDEGVAGRASLALEGHEIAPGRQIRVVSVPELFKEKAEIKVEKIQIGKKAASSTIAQPSAIKRPGQPGVRRGGHLGQKRGLGFKGARGESDMAQQGKTNDQFRAMLEKK